MSNTDPLKRYKQMSTITYAVSSVPIAFWICILARVLINKDRNKFIAIIVISILMLMT